MRPDVGDNLLSGDEDGHPHCHQGGHPHPHKEGGNFERFVYAT